MGTKKSSRRRPSVRAQVGALVRHHRERLGLTQLELASRTERSLELIGRIERGAAAPSFETLEALSAVLGVPIRDLFGVGVHAVGDGNAKLAAVVAKLARLTPEELEWADKLLTVALTRSVRNS